jgi:hypothetical protein
MLARLRHKNLDRWLLSWARHAARRRASAPYRGHRHLLFAFCDHYEPLWKRPPRAVADARVRRWREEYPRLASAFRDATGRPPRHSFFFPGEEYAPEFLEPLGELARAGLGEVEVHLHHDGDTPEKLRDDIARYTKLFAAHGHLAREGERLRYAFIHGNWCLANARRDRRWCGVDEEIPLLFETGCYADFTFPSAPDESQPGVVNEIYWPEGDLRRARAYEHGRRARVGEVMRDRILMIQGPLALRLRAHRVPVTIENAGITGLNPATPARVRCWVRQNVHVEGRPEWVFVKAYTHGAQEDQAASLLGDGGRALHTILTSRYNDGRRWSLHYVTAREMYNVALAAMEGKSGNPADHYDHHLKPPPVAA